MRFSDLTLGLLLVIAGAALSLGSTAYPDLPNQSYGASTFPFAVGLALLLLGAIFLGGVILRREQARAVVFVEWGRSPASWLRLALVLALVTFYVLLSPYLGFRIGAGLMLFGLLVTFRTPILTALIVTVVAVIGIEQVFGGILRVPLPTGSLVLGGIGDG